MIILYHNGKDVVEMANANALGVATVGGRSIAVVLFEIAQAHPKELLLWCHQDLKEQFNRQEIGNLFHHHKLLLSYNPSDTPFLGENIGYIDASLFIRANKQVPYASWQMSSAVGGIQAAVLLALNNAIPMDANFDYFLCSLAKLLMPKGLLCYSEPRLLKSHSKSVAPKTSSYTLFRFVKQHYRIRWVFLLLLNLFLYERKFPLLPFLFSFFHKNRNKINIDLEAIKVQSSRKVVDQATVDVIIPTIGRKDYLHAILEDLKAQTQLPANVIVVEQNPDEGSTSELDYLTTAAWPFAIKHTFTHQAGACNARNIALSQITSEWVFFADDDIRIGVDFIQKALEKINDFGAEAVSFKCLLKGQKQRNTTVFQWSSFGSGCSFALAEILKNCSFNRGYEFGFGEDGDFGMQLRHQGHDVLYLPEPEILHLKAPVGGFRTKPTLQWQNDDIQPKPSPTVMLYQLLHTTPAQTNSYKTTLFLKYYRLQKIKNPIRYYCTFQKQWARSVFWANKLKRQNEI
ncbi:glycosyltransferase family 2 protein [Flavobacterium limnophilum]|uniref:glycosyltransferase family 2 protein n=1 Tax=Flavobacterium limnophilum TaxID=3003262 RepID=UPI002482B58F|nr:glycosyltransferase family A protein [Flavobacterium limnophilum]